MPPSKGRRWWNYRPMGARKTYQVINKWPGNWCSTMSLSTWASSNIFFYLFQLLFILTVVILEFLWRLKISLIGCNSQPQYKLGNHMTVKNLKSNHLSGLRGATWTMISFLNSLTFWDFNPAAVWYRHCNYYSFFLHNLSLNIYLTK